MHLFHLLYAEMPLSLQLLRVNMGVSMLCCCLKYNLPTPTGTVDAVDGFNVVVGHGGGVGSVGRAVGRTAGVEVDSSSGYRSGKSCARDRRSLRIDQSGPHVAMNQRRTGKLLGNIV